ncbi:MAG: hypothetical protein EZS28_012143 [Streblomastix strix]|uniref:Uncharacterized protein n=1 Tax=Streblomastix strix TaxID=222440 RepID=A0A5J4WBY6_9EUKA|nr:MAG: hypothetical protein EZS28_012143 [Streblomastix strix]
MRLYVTHMKEMNPSELNIKTDEIRYIASSVRYDLREGVDDLTVRITNEGVTKIKQSQTILIIVMAISIVFIFVTLIFNSLVWGFDMQAESDRSLRLLDLMPVDENEKEMIFLPSMRTGYVKMDKEREQIMEIGKELIEFIDNKGHISELMSHFNQLMIQTYRTFQAEEKEMRNRKYDLEYAKEHTLIHLLLRQRLTMLGDQLRSSSGKLDSIRSTVRRTLSRLYDKHFCIQDIELVEEMIPPEERVMKNFGQDGDQQAENVQDGDAQSNLESTL